MRRQSSPFIWLLCVLLTIGMSCASIAAASRRYAIDVAVDYDAASFAGTLRLDYLNTTGIELSELFFRLYPNAAGIYGGAEIRIIEVLVDGRNVDTGMYVEDTVLYVPLREPLLPGSRVDVMIAFEGHAGAAPVATSIKRIEGYAAFLEVLGSYPADDGAAQRTGT